MSRIDFSNSTALSSDRLAEMIRLGTDGWAVGQVIVRVRYSRSADFSGACHYADQRILINLGRHVRYPYKMNTHLARTRTVGRRWYRPLYVIELTSAYDLAAFIFMHELYHLLVKRAGRNVRQKEGRCDRFAAGFMVDTFGTRVLSEKGVPLLRSEWDFQDVEGFVAAARDARVGRLPEKAVPIVRKASLPRVRKPVVNQPAAPMLGRQETRLAEQLLLFAM